MSDPTLQSIFDRVYKHLLAQGEPSMMPEPNSIGLCAYRGTHGLQCAVGCLITDEHYSPELENLGAHMPAIHLAVERSLGVELSCEAKGLLEELQGIHDATPPEDWAKRLAVFAERHDLEVPNA